MTAEQTFLFADLVGFTALAEALGDEYAADLAQHFCRELNARLPDGAEDFKMLGDACLVRVDDASAAVPLALRLTGGLGARPPFQLCGWGCTPAPPYDADTTGSG